ncbi:MAG: ATP-binding protein [Desulfobacterium sp.]|nr:ATP-binding protein [Desulfobacterium sp.]
MKNVSGADSTYTVDMVKKLGWLIWFRVVFAIVVAFSTFVYSKGEHLPTTGQPFVSLYSVAALLVVFSLMSAAVLPRVKTKVLFAYGQVMVDTLFITAIIFVTGKSESIFTFLYLVGIMGASMLLPRGGSIVIAAFSSVLYAVLVFFENQYLLDFHGTGSGLSIMAAWSQMVYRVVIIALACFAVAFLSGILAFQARRARRDLGVVERHLKRVERMAAMGEMVAGMAHEIKNPLASISGSIQLMAENTEPGSSNLRLMKIVLRETQRLNAIVTDFLLFAKPKSGTVKEMRLDLAIGEIVSLFRQDPLCADRIEITVKLDSPVLIAMDPGHLKQVLWNLLKNSAEAIERTGIISIRLKACRTDGIYLTVSDTGCGIIEEVQEIAFDPFFTTKRFGSGLGLSIVHRIIDSYQGVIDFETFPGKGTTFTLIFKDVSPSRS